MDVRISPAPRRFEGRVVLVFGAGCSPDGATNGSAAALGYAREGAHVICADIDGRAAERTLDGITTGGGQATAVVADVTDPGSVAVAVEVAMGVSGRIDVLHNNVGVTVMGGPVELSEADFLRSVQLNLGSVYRTCKAVIPHMIAAGHGAIVNISSLAAIRWTGYPYFAYSATKAAVNQATVSIALEYARHGIRANCILPGAIDTPLIYKQIAGQYASVEDMRRDRARMVPLGITGRPDDIAEAALFLASEQARFITGVCLPVDGGQSCAVRPAD